MLTRSRPRTWALPWLADEVASSRPASKGITRSHRVRPSSVSVSARVVRSNKRMPSRSSSREIARLTADGEMPSTTPARAKLPLSTTAPSTPRPFIMRSS